MVAKEAILAGVSPETNGLTFRNRLTVVDVSVIFSRVAAVIFDFDNAVSLFFSISLHIHSAPA